METKDSLSLQQVDTHHSLLFSQLRNDSPNSLFLSCFHSIVCYMCPIPEPMLYKT